MLKEEESIHTEQSNDTFGGLSPRHEKKVRRQVNVEVPRGENC